MAKKKNTLDTLAKLIQSGNATSDKSFAAIAEDIADIKQSIASKHDLADVEKRLTDRIDGVRVKVDGLQNEFDMRAIERVDQKLPERVSDLEKHNFGASRAPRLPRRA